MSPKVNANTVKSRNRYQLLKLIAKALFPSEKNPSGSTILTGFTQALYHHSPTPEKLSVEEVRGIVKGVLKELLDAMG